MQILRAPKVLCGIASLIFALCISVQVTHAAEIVAEPPTLIGVGDTFVVPILLDTKGDTINALEGELIFPDNTLSLREVRDGNSIVSLWLERPDVSALGSVRFAGIMPGGYRGESGEIMTLVFEAQKSGSGHFGLQAGAAYKNDGTGVSALMTIRTAVFRIEKTGSGAVVAPLTETDHSAPEAFEPTLSFDPNVFEGKNFVAFATQDKESAIDHYEVAEWRGFRWPLFQKLDWRPAASPFVLSDQTLGSFIYVKAIDRAGNARVSTLSPMHPPFYYSDVTLVVILLVSLMGLIFLYVRTRTTASS